MTVEQSLWCFVLQHALLDAAKGIDTDWIGGRDFRMVCALAGVEAEAVQERFDPERYRALIRAA